MTAAVFFRCCLYAALASAQGTMLSFSPEMTSIGPRFGFFLSALASVPGLMFAVAAWNSGRPGAGDVEGVVERRWASASGTALAKPYRNCSKVSVTAFLRLPGLPSTGNDAFNAENGSGSTPRLGAGSIATEAIASPRPAMIWASSPPNECPMTTGLRSSPAITSATWSATCPTEVPAKPSGFARRRGDVAGSPGQSGASATYPRSSNQARHASQLLGSSQSPWTKTTGWAPDSLARATSAASRSVRVVMLQHGRARRGRPVVQRSGRTRQPGVSR